MRLAWATDIHLDFITNPDDIAGSAKNLDIFCSLFKDNPEALILSGDISLADSLKNHLLALESRLQIPIYFVLGNHDFWGGGFDKTRRNMSDLMNSSAYLKYLSAIPYVPLTSNIAMIGHDGWYDGFNGEPKASGFLMNDWLRIADFTMAGSVTFYSNTQKVNVENILAVSRRQASAAAQHVARGIKSAISQIKPKKIVVVTHVPPFVHPLAFKENLYPWYSSKIMGEMLISAAAANPKIEFEVFCGHVHSAYEGRITSNIFLRSGKSEYSEPVSQGTFDISY